MYRKKKIISEVQNEPDNIYQLWTILTGLELRSVLVNKTLSLKSSLRQLSQFNLNKQDFIIFSNLFDLKDDELSSKI